jgi:hypothetical protein
VLLKAKAGPDSTAEEEGQVWDEKNDKPVIDWYVYSAFDFTTLQESSRSRALETCLGSSSAPSSNMY